MTESLDTTGCLHNQLSYRLRDWYVLRITLPQNLDWFWRWDIALENMCYPICHRSIYQCVVVLMEVSSRVFETNRYERAILLSKALALTSSPVTYSMDAMQLFDRYINSCSI